MRRLLLLTCLLCRSIAAAAPPVHEIAVPAAIGSGEPFLTTDTSGQLLLTWLEPVRKSDQTAVRFSRYEGNAWSAPRTIAAGDRWKIGPVDEEIVSCAQAQPARFTA